MNIVAVTTAFFPDENVILKNWDRISGCVSKYIVVDNSEGYNYSLLNLNNSFEIFYGENGGVSAGLNVGIRRAIDMRADYIVLFDQDSLSEQGLVERLIDSSRLFDGKVIVAPNILDSSTGSIIHESFFKRGKLLSSGYIEVNRTQMSGLLVPVSIFSEVGLFNESYFLNFVDTEWCLRACAKGYKILVDINSHLFHDFGAGEKRFFSLCFRFGQPFRGYYNARDALFLVGECYLSVKLRLRLVLSFLWGFLQILFLDQKRLRVRYYLKGVVDYFRGVRGRGRAFD